MIEEQVLCIKRNNLPKNWLQTRLSLPITWENFTSAAVGLTAEFQPRSQIENDPSFKQLIPYILLSDKQKKLAFYQRTGSEKRLLGCYSVGIGGHIRDADFTDSTFSWPELRFHALKRELEEELPGFLLESPPDFLGLINEEITKVGHSHLGLVFMIKNVDSENLVIGEELKTLQWSEAELLKQSDHFNFEIWSELAFELFSGQPPQT